jgi:hypothetical protein
MSMKAIILNKQEGGEDIDRQILGFVKPNFSHKTHECERNADSRERESKIPF